jgi:hypothetical protein
VNYRQDSEGYDTELRYFRDVQGREVDFVALESGKPVLFVECKSSNREVSAALRYLKARFPSIDAWQVAASGNEGYRTREGIRVAPALELLRTLVGADRHALASRSNARRAAYTVRHSPASPRDRHCRTPASSE